jgi:hypothetical protein
MINCRLTFGSPVVPVFFKKYIYFPKIPEIWFGFLKNQDLNSLVLSESLEPSSGSKPGSINQT